MEVFIYDDDNNEWKHAKSSKEKELKGLKFETINESFINNLCGGYIFGEFKNDLGLKQQDVVYSFDVDSKNFHIVPLPKSCEKYIENCNKIRKELYVPLEKIKNRDNQFKIVYSGKSGKGIKEWTECHRWLEIQFDGFSYTICFQSLALDDKKISCEFGRIQFHAFAEKLKGPNYMKEKDELVVMYPCEGEEYGQSASNHHRVKNTGFYVENLIKDSKDNDRIKELVKEFIVFINEVQSTRNHFLVIKEELDND